MEDLWTTIYERAEYDRIMAIAKAGNPVLIDGHLSIITHVEFDNGESRGRYKTTQIQPLPFGGTVKVYDDTNPPKNHVRDAVEANR
ncbi:hypothetical protein NDK50_07795 [Paraburkholderia bryophila]|uniref:hypothetical protein n=1 Tax=Paraburkholderia bryophila TaxID=420952 RepID=UPI002349ABCE|nr:hypothetical protein [Paraburkholderia bryophila]WCM21338.1 hypothetical protein NDK50_07795 [Paraburkholderia bryophila]